VKNLKTTFLGAVFLAGMSTLMSANAADVYSRGSLKDSGPVDYRPAISWTGFYIGAHAGGAFSDELDVTLSIDTDMGSRSRSNSLEIDNTWLAGLHLGYNWQSTGGLVLGVEGAWSFLGGDRDLDVADGLEIDDQWLASIRGRLGYAFGQTLVYATGGVAFLGSDHDKFFADAIGEDVFDFDDTTTGWVAGVGVEYKLRENVSLGLEGLYYAFEDDDTVSDDGGSATLDFERDFWTVQARVTYHFGDRHAAEPLK
jgi:outer membrane immunogenic protein